MDIVGLSKTIVCWSHHHLSSDFQSTLQRYARCQSKMTFGSVSPYIDKYYHGEMFQSGGNLTSILGSLVSYVGGPDIVDGTWLALDNGVASYRRDRMAKIVNFNGYYMRSDSPQTSSVGSSCLWECKFLRERYCTLLNLSQYLFINLHKQSWLFRKLVTAQYLCLI